MAHVYLSKFPIICIFHILYIFRDREPV